MTPTSSSPTWQTQAKLKLSRLRVAAGQIHGANIALSTEIMDVGLRLQALRRHRNDWEWAAYYQPAAAAKLAELTREQEDLETLLADLLNRRRAMESSPHPAGKLYHAAESILAILGVTNA